MANTSTGVFRRYRGTPQQFRRKKTYLNVCLIVGTASGTDACAGVIGLTGSASGTGTSTAVANIGYIASAAGAGDAQAVAFFSVNGSTASAAGAGDAQAVAFFSVNGSTASAAGAGDAQAVAFFGISAQGFIFDCFGNAIGAGNYIYAPIVISARPLITWMS
jgi:hypothetical protein